jgi:Yip1-like protein
METTNVALPPASDTGTEVSAVGRIPGAFFSPVRTFESIARRPTWLAPLLIWTILSVATTAVLLPKIDYDQVVREALQRRGQTIPEDRMASIVERQKKFGSIFGWVGGAVTPAVLSALVAVVIWGSFKVFGYDARFSQAFGATTHAYLPGVLKGAFLMFLVARQETVNPQNLGDLLSSNLGFLVPADSSKTLHALLASFDVFALWVVVLLVIGFAAATKARRGAAAGIIGTLWVLTVALRVGWNALF